MKLNFKLIIGIIYLVCLSVLLFYVFSNFDIRDLTSLTYIKKNSKYLVEFKDNNIIFFTIVFFIFSIIWVLLLGFGSPIAMASGFIFGKWYGTVISVLSLTIGCVLLYALANYYFSNFIKKKLTNKINKYKNLFNKNEFFYFMIFRLTGGGGIPFAIQNILPVIFNMKVKNYIYSTFLGLIPALFILNSLGAGIESIIGQQEAISLINIISNKDIYVPILGFIFLLVISFFMKKKFFRK